MSETAQSDSLAQRLATGRLSNPGVLDRRVLQRAHDRFASSTRAHLLSRLQRRATRATAGAVSLPLARIDRSVDVEAPPPGFTGAAATPNSAPALIADSRNTRSAPTISRTPAIVARRIAQTAGLVGGESTVARLFERSQQSGTSATHAPDVVASDAKGNAQSVAKRRVGRRGANTDSAVTNVSDSSQPSAGHLTGRIASMHAPRTSARDTGLASAALLMRRVDAREQGSVAGAGADSRSAAASPVRGVSSPTIGVASPPPATHQSASGSAAEPGSIAQTVRASAAASSRLVWRRSDPPAPTPAARAVPAMTAAPAISVAPQRLVLRKAIVPATRAEGPLQTPSISSAPTSAIARTHDAHGTSTYHAETGHAHDWNLDWIAEQVGKRLARRLEIERERTGVRQWRQAN